ncbi:MAG: mitochondrial fission ELM1 family protein [Kiritimatiellales bacterium]|nr:mitochondrial fission ELM1 family protein [Kiritimatiellales bacterium]
MKTALVISDGKPGHFNQSIALCKHLGLAYEVVEIAYKSRPHKALSYLLDRLGIYSEKLFPASSFKFQVSSFHLIISTGSTTYYANKLLAKRLGLPNIGILYPKGYRLNFSHIFCPFYDHPPKRRNITELPLNLCVANETFFNEKTNEFKLRHSLGKPAVGIIIGGPNAVSDMDAVEMEQQLERIFEATEGMERWVTTSRRTPKQIEGVIDGFKFDYKLINSRDPYNPIPAFIQLCDRLFVTSDSASMISECASFGSAKVEVLMNRQLKTPNKFEELIQGLAARNAVHVFEGTLGTADQKVDLGSLLRPAFNDLEAASRSSGSNTSVTDG